jgi:hypothetical protein
MDQQHDTSAMVHCCLSVLDSIRHAGVCDPRDPSPSFVAIEQSIYERID